MSVNRQRPHVLVLPEDDANRQIATGFHLDVDPTRMRQMQVLEEAGGWVHVLDIFEREHIAEMDRFAFRFMVLLIDFDAQENRLAKAKSRIPAQLTDRVFILGAFDEPEALKVDLGGFETIGSALATDCREDQAATWGHKLLQHNDDEVKRLSMSVRPILFA